ncbi:inositol monophosphatase family protein [Arthrobacter sp. NyZ413]|uniref:inositol monophosphatase family protein n=1 Tax=Arthrobacter sp. NyZ413 TaxID=3144669 RepID=UPI003BF8CF80
MSGNGQWTIEDLLTLASDTAIEAGGLLLERPGKAPDRIGTKAGAGDIVTDADRDSESLIIQRLLAARAEDGIIAKERGAFTGSTGLNWVIDPLDGSANYVRGATPFAVSVAACDAIEGRSLSPLVGAVFDPAQREIFRAALDTSGVHQLLHPSAKGTGSAA